MLLYGAASINATNLIKNYLSNRFQIVSVNNSLSNSQIINRGVPQGSKLGPLLFLMYINDISKLKLFSKMYLYADDITLICSAKTYNDLLNNCNHDLNLISNYCAENQLMINIKKTKAMLMFFDNDDLKLNLNNSNIDFVRDFKLLGYDLNYKLNFNNHFLNIKNQITRSSSTIYRLNLFFPKNILKLI